MNTSPIKSARIRELNDRLRCQGLGDRIMITNGIQGLGPNEIRGILKAVAQFDNFTDENDPWGEHDCATLQVGGHRVLFKIDYYDSSFRAHSPDAGDPDVTARVMTIMFADEY